VRILGDYHTHTCYSDGQTPVIDIVQAAKERGLSEIGISDHGPRKMLKGLKKKRFEKLVGEIQSAKSEMPVLLGVEANVISTSGKIDVNGSLREKLDLLMFGVHVVVWFTPMSFFTFFLPNVFFNAIHFVPGFMIRRNTKIVSRVLQKNQIDIYTHPGRYFRVDVVTLAKTCADRGILMELNSKKLSFRPVDFERMAATGAKFIIGSDAHSPKRVGDFARVEEFLKNCDYNPKDIINLEQTYTDYKTEKKKREDENLRGNQDGNTEQPEQKHHLWRH